MKNYPTQAAWLSTLTREKSIRTIAHSLGIKPTRLHRLITGTVEITLVEAFRIYRYADIDLLGHAFISAHNSDVAEVTRRSMKQVKASH